MGETAATNEAPITKEFLEKILKRKIVSFKSSGGSNPGDNFTSILISLEIVVEDSKEPLHLLFKTFPHHPTRQKMLEDTNLFLKEYQVYDIYIKELINFQKSILKMDKILVPAVPELMAGAAINYASGDPKQWADMNPMLSNFVLMVDVRKTYGFKMADKLQSLGYHHVKVVLEEIAKYHALGHAYRVHHKLDSILDKFPFLQDAFFDNPDQKGLMEGMMKGNLQLVRDACADFLESKPEIAASYDKWMDLSLTGEYLSMISTPKGMDEEKVESALRMKPNKYSGKPLKDQWIVPGHGDCWTNNMLFKSDENGNVSETVLVDLQIARESCMMADLSYFIYTSTDTTFRKEYLDEMLNLYHEKFVQFCKILKVDPFPGFTLENFQRRFHRSKIFGFIFATLVLPFILQRPETAVNLDTLEVKEDAGSDDMVEIFQQTGRDKADDKILRDRFVMLLDELYEEGVL